MKGPFKYPKYIALTDTRCTKTVLWCISINESSYVLFQSPWGWTYQFDGDILVSIEVFSQPQLSKVPTANFFAHTEVWANHKNSRIGPWTPAPMSSPAACCLRHLFPFLCLSFAPSFVKIHKLVIPWPLHGYSPAMQTIKTPITTTEEVKGGQMSHDRGKVLLLKCPMVWKTLKWAQTTAWSRTALLLSASLFVVVFLVYQRGFFLVCFSSSSFRETSLPDD